MVLLTPCSAAEIGTGRMLGHTDTALRPASPLHELSPGHQLCGSSPELAVARCREQTFPALVCRSEYLSLGS